MAIAVGGCLRPRAPAPDVGYFLACPAEVVDLHRVVLLPLENETRDPSVAEAATSALFRSLQQRQLFHVELARPRPTGTPELPEARSGRYELAHLAAVRRAYGCDGLLVGMVRQYRPYPKLQVALYLRLLDVRTGELLWAVEHVWDASDRATQQRIESFYARRVADGRNPVEWRLAMISTPAFLQFVTHEATGTLEAEEPAPAAPPPVARPASGPGPVTPDLREIAQVY